MIYEFTSDAIAPDEPITIQGDLIVQVMISVPSGVKYYITVGASTRVLKAEGEATRIAAPLPHQWTNQQVPFRTGQVVGLIAAPSGTLTYRQEELSA